MIHAIFDEPTIYIIYAWWIYSTSHVSPRVHNYPPVEELLKKSSIIPLHDFLPPESCHICQDLRGSNQQTRELPQHGQGLELESLVRTAFFRQTFSQIFTTTPVVTQGNAMVQMAVWQAIPQERFQGNVHGVAAISFCAALCFPTILRDSVTPCFFQRWMNARFVGPPQFFLLETQEVSRRFPLSRWLEHRHSSQFTPKCRTVPKIPEKKTCIE